MGCLLESTTLPSVRGELKLAAMGQKTNLSRTVGIAPGRKEIEPEVALG